MNIKSFLLVFLFSNTGPKNNAYAVTDKMQICHFISIGFEQFLQSACSITTELSPLYVSNKELAEIVQLHCSDIGIQQFCETDYTGRLIRYVKKEIRHGFAFGMCESGT